MTADRFARVRQQMQATGTDVLLLSVGPDLPWLTGYEAMPLERLTMLVVPVDGDATLVVPRLEAPRVVERPDRFALRPWEESEDPVRIVADLVGGPAATARLAVGDKTWARFLVDLQAALPGWRERLLAKREERVPPGLDDKVLTSWNGLAISAFAEAGRVLDAPRYIESARRTAEFIRTSMVRDGRLLHSYRAGEAKVDALLEDFAYLALGLVDLYRATGDLEHLRWAAELYEEAVTRFRDDDGTFFESPEDGEALILRQKPFFDSPTPSGNASMALLAFWLGRYFGRPEWEDASRAVVSSVAGQLPRAATGFGAMLQALELQVAPPREIVLIGDEIARAPFQREVARRYLPATVLAPAGSGEGLPLLEGRSAGDGATAYVCENMVCDLPSTSVSAFVEQLDR